MATVLSLIKMCKKKRYANDFLNGQLYSNRVGWYICQGIDKHEGEWLIQPSKDVVIELNNYRIPPEDPVSASVSLDRIKNLNVFCMFAVHSGTFTRVTPETVAAFRSQLNIPTACVRDFGKHSVVVHDVKEFYRRVDAAANAAGYPRARGLVRYYDPASFEMTCSNELEIPFFKRDEFSYQKELRIAMVTSPGCDAVVLDLGRDIRDIAEYGLTKHFATEVAIDEATDTLTISMTTRRPPCGVWKYLRIPGLGRA